MIWSGVVFGFLLHHFTNEQMWNNNNNYRSFDGMCYSVLRNNNIWILFIDLMNIDLINSVEIDFFHFFFVHTYSCVQCTVYRYVHWLNRWRSPKRASDLSYLKNVRSRFVCLSHWHDVVVVFHFFFLLLRSSSIIKKHLILLHIM